MDSNTSKRKRLFYVILLVIPTVILIQSSIKETISQLKMSEMAYQQLLEKQREVIKLTQNLLYYSTVLEVGEKLNQADWKDIPATISALTKRHPEISGICSVQGKDKFTTHYSATVPPETPELLIDIPDIFPEISDLEKDTLEYNLRRELFEREPVINAYYKQQYLIASFGYFKAGTSEFVVISDMEKLKERIPVIFDNWQRRLSVFGDYFLKFQRTRAQVRFYDQQDENFFTLGNSYTKGWDMIQKQHVGFLPWEIKVQIFPRQSELLEQASLRGKVPWGEIIPNLIGVVGIILLALLTKQFWWGRKYEDVKVKLSDFSDTA